MYCHRCGSFNPDDSNFCEKCGASLQDTPNVFVPAAAETNAPKEKKRKHKVHPLVWILIAIIVLGGIGTGLCVGLSSQTTNSFQEQLSLGEKYLQELKYEDAIVALNRAIEIDPKNEKPYLLLAQVYVAQEEYDSAVETLEKGLDATGGNQEIAEKLDEVKEMLSQEEAPQPSPSPSPSPTPTPVPTDTASASLERDDRSIKNENGEVIVQCYYDKLVLEESRREFSAINQLAQQACDSFFEGFSEGGMSTDMASPEYPFLNTVEGEITCNGGGIISVRLQSTWFMGGVQNTNFSGLNFNLETGEELKLTDVFSMDEASLLQYLQEQTLQYIDSTPDYGWWNDSFQDARQVVSEYTLDQYDFYIQDDTVYLCYPTYTLGPGAMGPVVIPCPIQ